MDEQDKLLSYLKRVTADLQQTKQRLREVEEARQEPIAVVAMGCRFPGGVRTPEQLWDLLVSGRDAVTDVPADRGWDVEALYDPDATRVGSSYVRRAAFLDGIGDFDAAFFGISPREALAMDPQQRLLLEVCWEALERAGIDPQSLRGSEVGVFAGTNGQDYPSLLMGASADVIGYLGTGNASSVLSGRVAYALGLEGPAVTIDTACSSSLVAMHLAAQALRSGECSIALAGGVTVMSTPTLFVEFSRQRGLAADGRCKPFAAAADGTAWGEGAGVLVLMRLSDARRDGHEVLAVLRGSAVNQDGASNGLTAPNGPSQRRVIRHALRHAGLTTSDVDVVEAHGTGTTLGDPIEAEALLATYGRDRDADRPLLLGSIKSNLGHTQAAAGVAGVMKVVLAMRHGVLPMTLNVDEPTPHVNWSAGHVKLATETAPWPEVDRPRRAGVSSFGISGTNAHVVLEQGPPTAPADRPAPGPVVAWPLSGRDRQAVLDQAERLAELLTRRPELDPADVAFSLATTRSAFDHRAVVVGASRDELLTGLRSVGERTTTALSGRTAFLFTGQGSQRVGMGRGLAASFPVFAEAWAEVLSYFPEEVRAVLSSDDVRVDETEFAQPGLFAVEVALSRLFASWGVTPDVVVGHSIGEIAAAHIAGVFSLADACRLVVARGALMQALPTGGAMVAVEASEDEITLPRGVSLAAVNGPRSVVLSGDEEPVLALAAEFASRGRRTKRLTVSHAFHSARMDAMLDDFRAVAASVSFAEPQVTFLSTVDDGSIADPEYWVRNVRQTVRFSDAAAKLSDHDVVRCVEIGPDAVLSALTGGLPCTPALRADRDDAVTAVTALSAVHATGGTVDWRAVHPGGRTVELPTYPFQRKRFWPEPRRGWFGDLAAAGLASAEHPLLAAVVSLADSHGLVLTGRLTPAGHPWLADHTVLGTPILPGTAFVELAVRAGDQVGCPTVADLAVETPLALPTDGSGVQLRVAVSAAGDDGGRAVTIHSRPEALADTDEWTRHASGSLVPSAPAPAAETEPWPPANADALDVTDAYAHFAERGFGYGDAFRGLRAAWRRGDDLFAEVALPEPVRGDAASFGVHPALLDAALHVVLLAAPTGDRAGAPAGGPLLPFSWGGVTVHATGATEARVRISPAGPDAITVTVTDVAGSALVTAESLVFRPLAAERATGATRSLFRTRWDRCELPSAAEAVHRCADPAAVRELLTAEPPARIVVVPTAAGAEAHDVHRVVNDVLELVRDYLAAPAWDGVRLVVRTGGPDDLAGAAVRGLLRTAQSEHPDRFVLLDATAEQVPDADVAAAVASGEPELAVHDGVWSVPRLVRASATPDDRAPWRADDRVLITGGTGALGAVIARHLVTVHGVRGLVLVGRRGPDAPGAAELAAELRDLGAEVDVVACDVADRDQLTALLRAHRVTAVVHTAGVLDDGTVEALTPERVSAVLRPKLDAALLLDQLAGDLSAFVLFSSAAGVFGNAGQGGYAAANAALDALARRRRARGLPAVSLAWGLWQTDGGMTGDLDEVDRNRMTRSGVRAFTAAEGTELFDAALADGHDVLVPIRLDVGVIRAQARGGAVPPLLRSLVPSTARRAAATGSDDGSSYAQRINGLDPDERERVVLDLVRSGVAGVLGHAGTDAVAPDSSFADLGFDSLTAVELRNRLASATGVRLPATLVFDHPSPIRLAGHLVERFSDAAPAQVVAVATATTDDPIAIVGMACRYPGGITTPEHLWQVVFEGRDAVGPFPDDRGWDVAALYHPDPDNPGTSYTAEGGFLRDAGGFDPVPFGISPREALAMDPQQRLLLETSWEAFERAGIDPRSVRGTATSVFTGVMYHDYAGRLLTVPEGVEGYLGTGNSGSVASGRISYTFGLEGPAVTVDTACSSSLVALHLAAQTLRSGECSLALAGGVAVMATPSTFVDFSRQRGLAADGRCKSFADAADGTGWSEGAGMLVLERLSDARRNGHPVLALVRGTAVNQDGASNGLTAPNGPSQERVIRQALANAGVRASDVDAVEAHGTGTVLGDPIEAQALIATYGRDRPADRPLALGSIKSNIGHSQAAAGVAGIIKMVEAMRHGVLPKTLHVDRPSTHVDWSEGAVELLVEQRPWPAVDRPRRAGVSSFGVSGTNAHVILEQPVPDAEPPRAEPSGIPVPWLLSAQNGEALRDQAARLLATAGENDPVDVAFSLARSRAAFEHRAVVVGATGDDFAAALRALAEGDVPRNAVRGRATRVGRPVFVFPGQGSQWVGMALELAEQSAVFAERLAECAAALDPFCDWSLHEALRGEVSLDRVDVVQPVLFAVMVSLAALWRSWGIEPAAVVGHSQGEIAAACVSGALSLEDAARVVALRSQVLRRLAGRGGMVSIAAPEAEVRALIEPFGERISIAAVNGPSAVVVSGEPDALDALVTDGLRAKRIAVDYASHSAQVEELREELAEVLAPITPRAGAIPLYSTLTGEVEDGSALDADYWFRNLRSTVGFADAVEKLAGDGFGVFVECSPHPLLTMAVQEQGDAVAVGSLRRDDGGLERMLLSLGELVVQGVTPKWVDVVAGGRLADLPTYPFQHNHFWLPAGKPAGDVASAGLRPAGHPVLGAAAVLADGSGALLTGRLSVETHPWLADHVVAGRVLLPGTALLDLVLCAAAHVVGGTPGVPELTLHAPLVLPDRGAVDLQVSVGADDGGTRPVTVHSRPADADDGTAWTRHVAGVVGPVAPSGVDLREWPPTGAEELPVDDAYEAFAAAGVEYGPVFQGLRRVWRRDAEVFAEVALPGQVDARGFDLHPALLDAALHAVGFGDFLARADESPWLPFTFSDVAVTATGATALRVRLSRAGVDAVAVDLADVEGAPVCSVAGLALRPLATEALPASTDALFTVAWTAVERPSTPGAVPAVLDATTGDPRDAIIRVLAAVRDRLADESDDGLLVVRTRGAAGPHPVDVEGAGVWGLVRTAQSEHPGRFMLLDTDHDPAPAELAAWAATGEPQLVIRDGAALAPRLVRPATPTQPLPETFGPDSVVLITGGTGTLGGLLARHLAGTRGVRNFLLVGRRGPEAPGAADLVADLGPGARAIACDVTDRDALAALFAEHAVTAVIHAAGVLDDGVITALTPERVAAVRAPKLDAALLLDELAGELDAFVVFSSAAGVFGGAGQGAYAAANAAVDALVARRRAAGRPGLSLAWGLWEQASGMTGHLDEVAHRRIARSSTSLSTAEALELFDRALARPEPVQVPIRLDLAAARARARTDDVPALLRALVRAPARQAAVAVAADPADRFAALPPQERLARLTDLVRAQAATVLGHAGPSAVETDRAFSDLGIDSLTAVELRNRLSAATGRKLPATLVFDHPTPLALARHLAGTYDGATAAVVRRSSADDPIVIVAMSCRFPGGVGTPEQLWDLVAAGGDAIGPWPTDRGWPTEALVRAGATATGLGGFLADAADFDADFFGISPREALAMDPQQRLLLETGWEALERAGIDPRSARGSRTGVFAGVMYSDYAATAGQSAEGYLAGSSASVVSGRMAYTFGFEGPAVTVDTACSSSLVAVHLAAQALRSGECDLALAGGVTVLANPGVFLEFTRQGGAASDGRCKAFAGAADGSGFSEGAGLLLLERLSDARANGHPVLAVVRGSAVNSDGASNGLTAPNGPSQQRVIGAALADAGLGAGDVDAVEAHGTGTTLGDPIEAQALIATYGQRDPDRPLWLGTVKSNLGHTQAAAGVAGVIKMVMALRHGVLPETLHVDEPSPHVDWSAGQVRLLTESRPWPEVDRPRRAAVSSFGISGTNAHLVLEHADEPAPAPSPAALPGPLAWPLSARTAPALRAQAARLLDRLDAANPTDLARSLATTRSVFEHRAVPVGRGVEELRTALERLADGRAPVPPALRDGGLAWTFSGQGSQRPGMGAALRRDVPAFAEEFDRVAAELDPLLDRPLADVIGTDLVHHTAHTQPALFALEVALAAVLRRWGLRPDVLLGHSIGELAAAHVAGIFDLPDACALVAARARLMRALPPTGAMLSLVATPEEASALADGVPGVLDLAAVNGPRATVLSGDLDAVEELARRASAAGVKTRRLRVSHAFHSAHLDPVLDEFRTVAAGLTAHPQVVPVISGVTGAPLTDAEAADPEHWVRQVRRSVLFHDAARSAHAAGAATFLELGPDGVLTAMIGDCVGPDADVRAAAVLRDGRDEAETLLSAVAAAAERGAPVDWAEVLRDRGGRVVDLPTYPFQRQRHWPAPHPARVGDLSAAGIDQAGHPLLGGIVPMADGGVLVTAELSAAAHPWLADHAVFGTTLLSGTTLLDLVLHVGDRVGCAAVEELTLEAPLVLPAADAVRLQVRVDPPGPDGRRAVDIHSRRRDDGDGTWLRQARGVLAPTAPPPAADTAAWPPADAEPLSVTGLYPALAAGGFGYGPAFRGLRAAWRHGADVLAEVELPEAAGDAAAFAVHPALLDAALHAVALTGGDARLPFAFTGVALHRRGVDRLRVRVRPGDAVSVTALGPDGTPGVEIAGLVLRPVSADQVRGADTDSLFHIEWIPLAGTPSDATPSAGTPSTANPLVVNPSAANPSAARWAFLGEEDSTADLELSATGTVDSYPDLAGLVAAIRAGAPVPTAVFVPRGLAGPRDRSARAEVGGLLALLRAWLAADALTDSRLVLLTRGTAAALPGDPVDPELSAAAGLLRSAQAENPGRFLLLDLDHEEALRRVLPAALAAGEPELAVRSGRLLAPRLVRTPVPDGPSGSFTSRDAVLVTGATGALGRLVARHLVVAHGVRDLLLVSRSGPAADGARELLADLADLGARADLVACDVADPAAVRELLAGHRVSAVVHTAGVLRDGVLDSLTDEHLDDVLRPKVDGARVLHELTADLDLTAFVLFSSAASVLGSAGQGNYAAANSYLDALARRRADAGLPALSLAWGSWALGGGMAADLAGTDVRRMSRAGVVPLGEQEGLALFDLALRGGHPVRVPVRLDLTALRSLAAVPAPLRALAPAAPRTAETPDVVTQVRDRLASLRGDELERAVRSVVRAEVADILGHADPGVVDTGRGFLDLGFDSLTAVELRNRLKALTNVQLPATLIFDHPSPDALAHHLAGLLADTDAGAADRAGALLAELDRLEAELTGAALDPATQLGVATRLRSLLKRVGARDDEDDTAAAGVALEDASDEEIFDFIDNELGGS
ncbi:SDR family NAD(P)-dependent oxidoreductase [Actinosynnema sp. CA-299493]